MKLPRRRFALGIAGLLAAARARGADGGAGPLDLTVLSLEHEAILALPTASEVPAPLVVLLHGLGETTDPHLGSHAWLDRYGLASSVARLEHPPLAPTSSASSSSRDARDDWGDALARENAALAARAYRGLAFVCPHVPRLGSGALDAYARWIDETLVPRARAEAGSRVDPSVPRLAGCSYGGWVSLEVLLRAPARFGAWAGVQTAIAASSAAPYADRLARVASGRKLLLETSTRDPFHDATVALARALGARGVPRDLTVLPGPHDQPWLRESGTPSLLAWLDRA